MAKKTFHINTEPHEATIGAVTYLFQPEVNGAEFATAYTKLNEVQKQFGDGADATFDDLVIITNALREFLVTFMLPESASVFVTKDLPDRILIELTNFLAEIYGGANGERPTGPSSAS